MKKFFALSVLSISLSAMAFAWEISAGYSGIGTDFSTIFISDTTYFGKISVYSEFRFGWGPATIYEYERDQFILGATSGVAYTIDPLLIGLNIGYDFGTLKAKERSNWYDYKPGDIIDKGDTVAFLLGFNVEPKFGYKIQIASDVFLTPSIGLNFDWMLVGAEEGATKVLSADLTRGSVFWGARPNIVEEAIATQYTLSLPIGLKLSVKKVLIGMDVNISLAGWQKVEIKTNGAYGIPKDIKVKESYTTSDIEKPVSLGFSIGYKF